MLYIDASRYNLTQNRTGVENYSYFLINEFIKQAPDQITLITPKKIDLSVSQIVIPFPRLWTQIRLSWKLFLNKTVDNLFIPSHVMPVIHPKNTVITIHDVAFKRYPKSYGYLSRFYLNWSTQYAVKHARHIITPSETTKQDLMNYYHANPEKISVIPLGHNQNKTQFSDEKEKEIIHKYQLNPKHYFLYLGRIETKKNIQILIRAFTAFNTENSGYQLVLAGKLGVGGENILKEIRNLNIVVTGYVDETTKNILLKNAGAFVFPSLFEGFGIPLLEAMMENLPIITSNIPSTVEIMKTNALYFESQDENKLTECMENVVKNPKISEPMIKNYSDILKNYTWEQCAQNTLKILEKKEIL